MAKQNDARRLFLRGQFALHKNSHGLNWKWSTLPHMTAALVLTRMKRVLSLLESRYPIDILKRMTFISAEGEYSSHIFDSLEFTILIAGRMMSDRVTQPVLWQQGALGRCKCPTVATCVSKEGSERRCIEMPTVTNRSHHEKRKMHLLPVNTTRGRHCGMNWLARKDQLCTESAPSSSMRANDAVLLKVRQDIINSFFSGKLDLTRPQGSEQWYLNSIRPTFKSEAMFHFRQARSEYNVNFYSIVSLFCF